MVIRRNCGFFWVKGLKLYGIAIFDHYLTNFIGKKYQTCSKIRFVSKADFCGSFGLCKIAKYMILFNL